MRPPLDVLAATAERPLMARAGLTHFGGCDYLGLSRHPRLIRSAQEAAARWGLSTSASRTTTGNTPVHDELEAALEVFFQSALRGRRATLTLDGLTANIAALEAVGGPDATAIIDERAHRSLTLAARAAGCHVVRFRHADAADARRAIDAAGGAPVIVITDGVFTAGGRIAPLPELLEAAPEGGMLLVDECHGLGVLGDGGRGAVVHFGIDDPRIVITSTLAKGMGAGGGFVLAPAGVHDRMRSASTAFVGTTPISPVVAAAACESIRVIDDEPWRLQRLRENASLLERTLAAAGTLDRPEGDAPIPIAAIPVASAEREAALDDAWRRASIDVPCMGYPGGPGARYFRISVTAEHSPDDVERLTRAVRDASGE